MSFLCLVLIQITRGRHRRLPEEEGGGEVDHLGDERMEEGEGKVGVGEGLEEVRVASGVEGREAGGGGGARS